MGIQHSGTITIRPQQKIPEHRDTRRLGMERIKPKTTSNSPSHQTTNTGKQIETPRTTIIPMKLIPANKQTTFEKTSYKCDSSRNYRYQNRDPVPYTNEERKELSEFGFGPWSDKLVQKKKKKKRGERRNKKKKKKKKKKKS